MGDILISGAVKPTTTNTPTDARTRVQTYDDIEFIENPFVGMHVYVLDEQEEYTIHALKSKEVAGFEIPDAAVDMDGVAKSNAKVDERINNLQEELNQLKGILSVQDEDGNGVPDGEDRLRIIEQSTRPLTDEEYQNIRNLIQ